MTEDTATWPAPRENSEFIGHDEIELSLADAVASSRLPHALLLAGPRGIGKATLAHRLARFILSNDIPGRATPDGPGLFGDVLPPAGGAGQGLYVDPEHQVFRRAAAGGHSDLLVIERGLNDRGKPRKEIVVDDVRGVGRFMSMTAAEGGWRVVVVDSADEMNRNAANAILKVLEEPPARALILLVGHNPGRLLPTIRSRCRRIDLRPLDTSTVVTLLDRYTEGLTADEAALLAALADGSIGRALALQEAGGLALFDEISGLMVALPSIDTPALHDFAGRVGRAGADVAFATALDLFRWWLERLIIGRATGRFDAGAANANAADAVGRFARGLDLTRLLAFRDQAEAWMARVDHLNMERRQTILNLFIGLAAATRA